MVPHAYLAAWEACKENAQPVRSGRKVEVLHKALEAPATDIAKQREEWEARLQTASADGDPLKLWLDYLGWHRDMCVSGGGPAQQMLPLLERCVFAFKDDSRYTDDVRYLRVWISYADLVRDTESIFNYLYGRQIGQLHTLFWESWAAVLEGKRKHDAADKVFTKGILMRAQPAGRLESAHRQFQLRLGKFIRGQMEEMMGTGSERPAGSGGGGVGGAAPGLGGAGRPKERKTLNRLTKKEAAGSHRPTTQRAAAPLVGGVRPRAAGGGGGGGGGGSGGGGGGGGGGAAVAVAGSASGGNAILIFEDASIDGDGQAELGAPAPWEMGTATENWKENTGIATKWTEAKPLVSKRSRRVPPPPAASAARGPGFEIHADDDLPSEDAPADVAETAARALPVRLQLAGSSLLQSESIAQLQDNPLARFAGDALRAPLDLVDDEIASRATDAPTQPTPTDRENRPPAKPASLTTVARTATASATVHTAATAARAAVAPPPAVATMSKSQDASGFDPSLLVYDGEECTFEEARARQRHGYGVSPPVAKDVAEAPSSDEADEAMDMTVAVGGILSKATAPPPTAPPAVAAPAATAPAATAPAATAPAATAPPAPSQVVDENAHAAAVAPAHDALAAPKPSALGVRSVASTALPSQGAAIALRRQESKESTASYGDDGMTMNTKAAMQALMPCFIGDVDDAAHASAVCPPPPPPAPAANEPSFAIFDDTVQQPSPTAGTHDTGDADGAAAFAIFDDSIGGAEATPPPPPPPPPPEAADSEFAIFSDAPALDVPFGNATTPGAPSALSATPQSERTRSRPVLKLIDVDTPLLAATSAEPEPSAGALAGAEGRKGHALMAALQTDTPRPPANAAPMRRPPLAVCADTPRPGGALGATASGRAAAYAASPAAAPLSARLTRRSVLSAEVDAGARAPRAGGSPEYTINTKAALADLLPCFTGEGGDDADDGGADASVPPPPPLASGPPAALDSFTIFDDATDATEPPPPPPPPADAPFSIFYDVSPEPPPPPPPPSDVPLPLVAAAPKAPLVSSSRALAAPALPGVTLYDASAPPGPLVPFDDEDDDLRAPTCRGLLRMLATSKDVGIMPPPPPPPPPASARDENSQSFSIFDDSSADSEPPPPPPPPPFD